MKKIAVVGVYGVGEDFTTGQAVKCLSLINWLKDKFEKENVKVVNTHNWRKTPLKLVADSVLAVKNCKNIIIMPAQHGVKIFAPLFYYLNKIFRRKIHYIVIGGWIAEMLADNPFLKKCISSFDGVHVETKSMKIKLEKMGLKNVYYMPNSRKFDLTITNQKKIGDVVKLCTYSRVVKEKGILDAIEICRKANQKIGHKVFFLDVYGKVAAEFQDEFDNALKSNEEFVEYCGCKNADQTVATLSNYYILLFPTYYEGEGFAGTVLDAFVTQTPIIANDWKYNSEIIQNRRNGMLYPFRDTDIASEMLVELYHNNNLYNTICSECKNSAVEYSIDNVMGSFCNLLD